jgi:hypothetical protein
MRDLLRSQAIVATRDEINKSTIAQILKLLTYLWFDVLIAGIEVAKMALERIDFVKGEVALPQRFHTFHDVEQPSARFRRFIPEEQRFLPFGKDHFFRPNYPTLHDMNLPGLGTRSSRIFEPTHPARRAVAESGFRSSMISRTKKCFGTINRFTTARDLRS